MQLSETVVLPFYVAQVVEPVVALVLVVVFPRHSVPTVVCLAALTVVSIAERPRFWQFSWLHTYVV